MDLKLVGMESSYNGLSQSDWLWKQTPYPFGRWGEIQMIARHHKPDYLLLYELNFRTCLYSPSMTLKQRIKTNNWKNYFASPQTTAEDKLLDRLRHVPKDNIFFLMREPPLPEVVGKQKNNYVLAQKYCGYVSGPSDFAPIPDYMPAIWYVNVPFEVLKNGVPPEKVGQCSWITSGISRTENHRKRLQFLKDLKETDLLIDIYGRGLPDWAWSNGTLENKWSGMAPYYYNLAIENYADNDLYVSEKLWDSLLSWCLPIYYGGPAADKLLPPGSFLRLPSLDEKGIAYIKDVIASPDAWHEAKEAISEARQIILNKLNLLNWLDERIKAL
jgi:hypothetical protein